MLGSPGRLAKIVAYIFITLAFLYVANSSHQVAKENIHNSVMVRQSQRESCLRSNERSFQTDRRVDILFKIAIRASGDSSIRRMLVRNRTQVPPAQVLDCKNLYPSLGR